MRKKSLRDRLASHDGSRPVGWRPQPGSAIVGTVLRYEHAESAYGLKEICVIEEADSGEAVAVWLLHAVLIGEFKKLRPKPGDEIGIKRLDDSEKGYARYAVILDRDEESIPECGEAEDTRDVLLPDEDDSESDGKVLVTDDGLPF